MRVGKLFQISVGRAVGYRILFDSGAFLCDLALHFLLRTGLCFGPALKSSVPAHQKSIFPIESIFQTLTTYHLQRKQRRSPIQLGCFFPTWHSHGGTLSYSNRSSRKRNSQLDLMGLFSPLQPESYGRANRECKDATPGVSDLLFIPPWPPT